MRKKSSKCIYDKYITIDNIYHMWNIVKKTCKNKQGILEFQANLSSNIIEIYNELKTRSYVPSRYKTFMIFEPKARLVMSQNIKDKIVNHFITNYYLIPYLEGSLIDSNVATRVGKGSSYAKKLLTKYINKILINNKGSEIYCLKIDISKYFYSISHDKLLSMLKNKILDEDVINIIKVIISETNNDYINRNIELYNKKYHTDIPYYKDGFGLSIGAMSSQFLAIYYLNDIDHYIKEILKCKYYIRYMDDFIILDINKDRLINIYKDICKEINSLDLIINKKSNIYKCSIGFKFLGYKYKIYNNKIDITIINKSFYRIMKKLKKLKINNPIKYNSSLGSYNGYLDINNESGFSMSTEDIYNGYKVKYEKRLVIVKDGIFHTTYGDDAKILWYLFDYKYNGNKISFGKNSHTKVINELNKYELGYVIVDKQNIICEHIGDIDNYITYVKLSNKRLAKKNKENILVDKLISIINKNPDIYNEINTYLDKLN